MRIPRSRGRRAVPRFNFGHYEIESADQTATLKELFDEINHERKISDSWLMVNIKSLKHILPLLSRLSGREYKSITEPLPLTTLKTIKLLYVENMLLNPRQYKTKTTNKTKSSAPTPDKGIHLLNLIEIPTCDTASMESATGTSLAQDARGREAINKICNTLALEIPLSELFLYSTKTRTHSECLIDDIGRANEVISQRLVDAFPENPDARGKAFRDLAKFILRNSEKTPHPSLLETPLHERLYVHLRCIGFEHFVLHYFKFIRRIKIKLDENPSTQSQITTLFSALCNAVGNETSPKLQLYSYSDVWKFVQNHSEHITPLIAKITGLPTRRKSLVEDARRAMMILRSYAYRRFDTLNHDARVLTIHDIIAALCAFKCQQSIKTPYQPTWFGQNTSEGHATKKHLDKFIDQALMELLEKRERNLYAYQGPFQIYYHLFAQYKAHLDGTTQSHRGWMKFQLTRLCAYIEITRLRDIGGFIESARNFDEICTLEATRIAQRHHL